MLRLQWFYNKYSTSGTQFSFMKIKKLNLDFKSEINVMTLTYILKLGITTQKTSVKT